MPTTSAIHSMGLIPWGCSRFETVWTIGLDMVGFTIGIDGGAAGGNVAGYTDGERYRVCVAGGKGVQTAPLIEFNPDIPSHSTTLTAGAELGAGVAAIGTEAAVTYQWDEQCFEASLDTGLDVGPMSFDMFHLDDAPSGAPYTPTR